MAWPMMLLLAATASAWQPDPAFDAVSIKRSIDGGGGTRTGAMGVGRFVLTNGRIRDLVTNAYGRHSFEVVGGPRWMSSDRYDVVASAGRDVPWAEMQRMLRRMLADRFKFVAHSETRDLPIYTLQYARSDRRLGPRLRPWTTDCAAVREGRATPPAPLRAGDDIAPPCSMRAQQGFFAAGGISMADFLSSLSSDLERHIVDTTGLAGQFELVLEWAPAGVPDNSLPSLFAALQEQLGLRLKASRGPATVLVVDRIERPSEN